MPTQYRPPYQWVYWLITAPSRTGSERVAFVNHVDIAFAINLALNIPSVHLPPPGTKGGCNASVDRRVRWPFFFFPPASFNCINRLSTTSIYIFGTSLASFCWFLSPIWFFIWSFRSKSHRKTNIIQTVSLLFFMRPHEIAWENKASTEQRNNTYPVPDEISPPWWPTKNKCPDGWLPPNLNGKTN